MLARGSHESRVQQPPYGPESRDSSPCFLVARVTPALSKSCRLAVDLPVLGVLTWLCGGARRPRRGIPTQDLWRRVRQLFPALRRCTEKQLGNSLRRVWRAGLATVDERQHWRPCWSADAMVCRVDVAFWRREDVSAAAKRVDAVAGHRIARGRSDAAAWLGVQCGMQRGRICAALRELEKVGKIVCTGERSSLRGRWPAWSIGTSTGTQAQGVPLTHPSLSAPRHTGAASPKTRAARLAVPEGPAPLRGTSTRVLDSSTPRPAPRLDAEILSKASAAPVTAAWLEQLGVATPLRALTAAGTRGLLRLRAQLAARLTMQGVRRGTVAAWLLQHLRDGLAPPRAAVALVAAIRARGSDVSAFVKRRGAEALLAAGKHQDAAAAVAGGVAAQLGAWREQAGADRVLQTHTPCDTSVRRMTLLRRELARLESAWRAAPGSVRHELRGQHRQARLRLLSQLADPDPSPPPPLLARSTTLPCSPSGTSSLRTAGSR